jgi:cholesterol oxidase
LKGVRSIVFSQVAGHLRAPLANQMRAGLHLPGVLDVLGVSSLSATEPATPNWHDRLFDQVAALNPAIPHSEHCQSTVCHRISFMYAPLYLHANLNAQTHDTLAEQFGTAPIAAFEHLTLMVRKGKVVAADGSDIYLPDTDSMALTECLSYTPMPILLIHGAQNDCYLPEGTEADFQTLRTVFNPSRVERRVIEDYGHIDCIIGQRAAQDVFPSILDHLNGYA